jgi:glutaredoxin 3
MSDNSELKGGELILYVTYLGAIRKTASDIQRLCLILDGHKIPYTKIDLGVNPEKREEMVKRSGKKTLPQVFIDETYIGVCNCCY